MNEHRPIHDEIEQARAPAGQEPFSGDLDISLSIPATIEIRMVDASTLADYEIWFFGSSGLLSFLVGFIVAWSQEADAHASKILGVVCLIFAALFIACLIMTLVKRHTLRRKSRTIRLKTSKVGEIKESGGPALT
ncbi:MAG: hypothetical protein AB7T27_10140 [Kiritimatiellia bacterium]